MNSNEKNWFGIINDKPKMIQAQRQQIAVRIMLSLLGIAYLAAHPALFMPHIQLIIGALSLYLTFNLLCLPWIKRSPFHGFRLILAPIFDIYLTALTMWLDGGISSPYYIVFLIVIAGNGVRFGNIMLLYTQALSILALTGIGVATVYIIQQPIDWLHMLMQFFGIILVPIYGYVLGQQLDKERYASHRAEQETLGLLDASPIPAFTFASTSNGRPNICYANLAMSVLFNEMPEQMRGKGVGHLAIHEDIADIRSGCQKVLQQSDLQAVHRFDMRSRSQDGQLHSLMCQASAIRWRGQLIGLCLMTDVTENERLHEKLESAHRHDYINSLLAGLTHDFRNVLTNIIGNAEVMQMETENKSFSNRLKLIVQAGERGSEMITHLLHMVRRKKVTRAVIRLQDTLHATIRLAHLKLPENIGLECFIADNLPPLMGHAAQIDQVILNLIENSSHAIQKSGSIKVNVETDEHHKLASSHAPAILITVQDNGCGIKQDDLEHVFDSFWTSREDTGGTGLGLTMVKRIVGWHHGEVAIDSKLGRGTTVRIVLPPITEGEILKEEETAAGKLEITSNTAIQPWRILLVDDDYDVLSIHQALLERLKLSVTCAGSGEEALRILLNHGTDFDMIITDYHMPQMNGLELTQRIRETLSEIPVLMVTAFSEDEKLDSIPEHGFSLLSKPLSTKSLATHIVHIQRNTD